MANPNIVNITSFLGKTTTLAIPTSYTALVTAATDTVVKINTLYISAVDPGGVGATNISLRINDGVNLHRLVNNIVIPYGASFLPISKDACLYLEEGFSLEIVASNVNFAEAVCSYEILS